VTNGGTQWDHAVTLSNMWTTIDEFFHSDAPSLLARDEPLQTVTGAGSRYAKVGYVSYQQGGMEFVETRWLRNESQRVLLPQVMDQALGTRGVDALRHAYDMIADIGSRLVEITVAASTLEAASLEQWPADAAEPAARDMTRQVLDNGRMLECDNGQVATVDCPVSMSPHRICRYSSVLSNSTHEIFGAHTDSSFVTVSSPVPAVC
jgi:hypothetical protein